MDISQVDFNCHGMLRREEGVEGGREGGKREGGREGRGREGGRGEGWREGGKRESERERENNH